MTVGARLFECHIAHHGEEERQMDDHAAQQLRSQVVARSHTCLGGVGGGQLATCHVLYTRLVCGASSSGALRVQAHVTPSSSWTIPPRARNAESRAQSHTTWRSPRPLKSTKNMSVPNSSSTCLRKLPPAPVTKPTATDGTMMTVRSLSSAARVLDRDWAHALHHNGLDVFDLLALMLSASDLEREGVLEQVEVCTGDSAPNNVTSTTRPACDDDVTAWGLQRPMN
jgi:hypothetical protein